MLIKAASVRESNESEQQHSVTVLILDRLLLSWWWEALKSPLLTQTHTHTCSQICIMETCFPAGIQKRLQENKKLEQFLWEWKCAAASATLVCKSVRNKSLLGRVTVNLYCRWSCLASSVHLPPESFWSWTLKIFLVFSKLLSPFIILSYSPQIWQALLKPWTGSYLNPYSWGRLWTLFISQWTAAEWATVAVN